MSFSYIGHWLLLHLDPELLAQDGSRYDYPPASDSSSRPPVSSSTPPIPEFPPTPEFPHVTARLQHLRDLLDSDRASSRQAVRQRALETLDQELEQMDAEPLSQRLERRRRRIIARERSQVASRAAEREPSPIAIQPPSGPLNRPRRWATRPSEILQRNRDRLDQANQTRNELEQASAQLVEAGAVMSSLLDRPIPRIGSPEITAQEYSGEAQVNYANRSRAKKRKLDGDMKPLSGFSYGHYGQVVPGPLRMEIVNCDGGELLEHSDTAYPENVLIPDSSVYCTKSDRCNIILRHQGEMPFELKKLVIKAPKSGFDAPYVVPAFRRLMLTACRIQEGMIFVSMTQDDLLERTAQYRIQYMSGSSRHRPRQSQIRLQPTHAYFHSARTPLTERTLLADLADSQEYHARNQPDPPLSARSQQFRITTDFDERSDEDEEGELDEDTEVIQQALNFQYLDAEFLCSDDDEDPEDLPNHGEASYEQLQRALNRANVASRRLDQHTLHMRRRMTPSLIEPPERRPISPAVGESIEVLKPHARFFIERDKNMVSVKFDPPA